MWQTPSLGKEMPLDNTVLTVCQIGLLISGSMSCFVFVLSSYFTSLSFSVPCLCMSFCHFTNSIFLLLCYCKFLLFITAFCPIHLFMLSSPYPLLCLLFPPCLLLCLLMPPILHLSFPKSCCLAHPRPTSCEIGRSTSFYWTVSLHFTSSGDRASHHSTDYNPGPPAALCISN